MRHRLVRTLGEPSMASKSILLRLADMPFFSERGNFTVEQVREIIRVVLPTKTRTLNTSHTSYGIKHTIERISSYMTGKEFSKYCSNDVLKQAMHEEGFRHDEGLNWHFNMSEKEYKFIATVSAQNGHFSGEVGKSRRWFAERKSQPSE